MSKDKIPDTIPADTLAYKWCEQRGCRGLIHVSFRRDIPDGYDEDGLNRAIDEALARYPEAAEAFPAVDKDSYVKNAERVTKSFMREYNIDQYHALEHMQTWLPTCYDAYMDRLHSYKSFRTRFLRIGRPAQNKRARKWHRHMWPQDDLPQD